MIDEMVGNLTPNGAATIRRSPEPYAPRRAHAPVTDTPAAAPTRRTAQASLPAPGCAFPVPNRGRPRLAPRPSPASTPGSPHILVRTRVRETCAAAAPCLAPWIPRAHRGD